MNRSRREIVLATATAAALAARPGSAQDADRVRRRTIPSSGEMVPAVGLGTVRGAGRIGEEDAYAQLRATIETFIEAGGLLIDTAPSHGDAESIIGRVIAKHPARDRLFLSTRVQAAGRRAGIEQVENSFKRLRPAGLDLILVHDLEDVSTQLPLLRDLREAQLLRYLGVSAAGDTHTADLEAVMRRERLDFIQVDFSLDSRRLAGQLLPLALEREVAVMVRMPLGPGKSFGALAGRPLPSWAADFDCKSWSQFFLKYVLAHEAVTCVIADITRPGAVADLLGAAQGRLPDAALRLRMEEWIDAL